MWRVVSNTVLSTGPVIGFQDFCADGDVIIQRQPAALGYGFDTAPGFEFILNVLCLVCAICVGVEWWK